MLNIESGEFEALGTTINVELPSASFVQGFDFFKAEALRIEKKFSRFEPYSALSLLNKNLNEWQPIDDEFYNLLKTAQHLTNITHGRLNLGTTYLLTHWGYDADYNLKKTAEPKAFETLYLELKPGFVRLNVPLDFGSFGKGYFLDKAVSILQELGVASYLVNAGGDLVTKTVAPQAAPTIFLEDPRLNKRVIGECKWANGVMCASSPSKRKWGAFHHLINIENQAPASDMLAVYVQYSGQGLVADALSTAFFVMGFEAATLAWENLNALYPTLEIMLIAPTGKIWRSPHFKVKLYTV